MSTETQIDDGGPAFPIVLPGFGTPTGVIDAETESYGMSLRDYFKAAAIPAAVQLWIESSESQRMTWSTCVDSAILKQRDYPRFIDNVTAWIADELLAARKQVQK